MADYKAVIKAGFSNFDVFSWWLCLALNIFSGLVWTQVNSLRDDRSPDMITHPFQVAVYPFLIYHTLLLGFLLWGRYITYHYAKTPEERLAAYIRCIRSQVTMPFDWSPLCTTRYSPFLQAPVPELKVFACLVGVSAKICLGFYFVLVCSGTLAHLRASADEYHYMARVFGEAVVT